ncbi:MAG: aldehyde dehydrogenase family protein [Oscillospiraceae bacterium]
MDTQTIDYATYMKGLVDRARVAQKVAEGQYDQARVDELVEAVSYACIDETFRRTAAQMLVDEAGLGVVEHKFNKIRNKSMGVYRDMKGVKSVGIIETDSEHNTVTYCKPMGVIGAVLPLTNGEATPIVKSLWALKSRNAIIFSAARKGKNTAKFVVDRIRATLKQFGAPEDLVICIDPEHAGRESCAEMMKQCDFIVATGGSGLVHSAYSSGTPAIGVGVGNATTFIACDADLAGAADKISKSKNFDFSSSCSSENSAVVDESIYDAFVKELVAHGGYIIKNDSPEKQGLCKALWPEWPENHKLNKTLPARSPQKVMAAAGYTIPDDIKFIAVEEFGGVGPKYVFTGEKLTPVVTLVKAKDLDDGLDKMEAILNYMGNGHSCGIHTTDDKKVHKMAERMHVARILVNQPQALGNSGAYFNGLPITMSLGCATWGKNSTCSNVTWKDICNTTTVSWPVEEIVPTEEGLYSEKIRNYKFNF